MNNSRCENSRSPSAGVSIPPPVLAQQLLAPNRSQSQPLSKECPQATTSLIPRQASKPPIRTAFNRNRGQAGKSTLAQMLYLPHQHQGSIQQLARLQAKPRELLDRHNSLRQLARQASPSLNSLPQANSLQKFCLVPSHLLKSGPLVQGLIQYSRQEAGQALMSDKKRHQTKPDGRGILKSKSRSLNKVPKITTFFQETRAPLEQDDRTADCLEQVGNTLKTEANRIKSQSLTSLHHPYQRLKSGNTGAEKPMHPSTSDPNFIEINKKYRSNLSEVNHFLKSHLKSNNEQRDTLKTAKASKFVMPNGSHNPYSLKKKRKKHQDDAVIDNPRAQLREKRTSDEDLIEGHEINDLRVDAVEMYQLKNEVASEQFKKAEPKIHMNESEHNFSEHYIISRGQIYLKEEYYKLSDEVKSKYDYKDSFVEGLDDKDASCSGSNDYSVYGMSVGVVEGDDKSVANISLVQKHRARGPGKKNSIILNKKPTIASIANLQAGPLDQQQIDIEQVVKNVVARTKPSPPKFQTHQQIREGPHKVPVHDKAKAHANETSNTVLDNDNTLKTPAYYNDMGYGSSKSLMERSIHLRWREFLHKINIKKYVVILWQHPQTKDSLIPGQGHFQPRRVYTALCKRIEILSEEFKFSAGGSKNQAPFNFESIANERQRKEQAKKSQMKIRLFFSLGFEKTKTNLQLMEKLKLAENKEFQIQQRFEDELAYEGSPEYESKSSHLDIHNLHENRQMQNLNTTFRDECSESILYFQLQVKKRQNSHYTKMEYFKEKLYFACLAHSVEDFMKYLSKVMQILQVFSGVYGVKLVLQQKCNQNAPYRPRSKKSSKQKDEQNKTLREAAIKSKLKNKSLDKKSQVSKQKKVKIEEIPVEVAKYQTEADKNQEEQNSVHTKTANIAAMCQHKNLLRSYVRSSHSYTFKQINTKRNSNAIILSEINQRYNELLRRGLMNYADTEIQIEDGSSNGLGGRRKQSQLGRGDYSGSINVAASELENFSFLSKQAQIIDSQHRHNRKKAERRAKIKNLVQFQLEEDSVTQTPGSKMAHGNPEDLLNQAELIEHGAQINGIQEACHNQLEEESQDSHAEQMAEPNSEKNTFMSESGVGFDIVVARTKKSSFMEAKSEQKIDQIHEVSEDKETEPLDNQFGTASFSITENVRHQGFINIHGKYFLYVFEAKLPTFHPVLKSGLDFLGFRNDKLTLCQQYAIKIEIVHELMNQKASIINYESDQDSTAGRKNISTIKLGENWGYLKIKQQLKNFSHSQRRPHTLGELKFRPKEKIKISFIQFSALKTVAYSMFGIDSLEDSDDEQKGTKHQTLFDQRMYISSGYGQRPSGEFQRSEQGLIKIIACQQEKISFLPCTQRVNDAKTELSQTNPRCTPNFSVDEGSRAAQSDNKNQISIYPSECQLSAGQQISLQASRSLTIFQRKKMQDFNQNNRKLRKDQRALKSRLASLINQSQINEFDVEKQDKVLEEAHQAEQKSQGDEIKYGKRNRIKFIQSQADFVEANKEEQTKECINQSKVNSLANLPSIFYKNRNDSRNLNAVEPSSSLNTNKAKHVRKLMQMSHQFFILVQLSKSCFYGSLEGRKFYRPISSEKIKIGPAQASRNLLTQSKHSKWPPLYNLKTASQNLECRRGFTFSAELQIKSTLVFLQSKNPQAKRKSSAFQQKNENYFRIKAETNKDVDNLISFRNIQKKVEHKTCQNSKNLKGIIKCQIVAGNRKPLIDSGYGKTECRKRQPQCNRAYSKNKQIVEKPAKGQMLQNKVVRIIIQSQKIFKIDVIHVPISTITYQNRQQSLTRNLPRWGQSSEQTGNLAGGYIKGYIEKLVKVPTCTYAKFTAGTPIEQIVCRKVKKLCAGFYVIFSVVYIELMKCGYLKAYASWIQRSMYFKLASNKFEGMFQASPKNCKSTSQIKQALKNPQKQWGELLELYTHKLKTCYFKKDVQQFVEKLKIKNMQIYTAMMSKNSSGLTSHNTANVNLNMMPEARGVKLRRNKENNNKINKAIDESEAVLFSSLARRYIRSPRGELFLIQLYVIVPEVKPDNLSFTNAIAASKNPRIAPDDQPLASNIINIEVSQAQSLLKLKYEWDLDHLNTEDLEESEKASVEAQQSQRDQHQPKAPRVAINRYSESQWDNSSLVPQKIYRYVMNNMAKIIQHPQRIQRAYTQQHLKFFLRSNSTHRGRTEKKDEQAYNSFLIMGSQSKECDKVKYFAYIFYVRRLTDRWVAFENIQVRSVANKSVQKRLLTKAEGGFGPPRKRRITLHEMNSNQTREIRLSKIGFQDHVPLESYNKRLAKRACKFLQYCRF